jgi:riboflavin synthase alpha subunit
MEQQVWNILQHIILLGYINKAERQFANMKFSSTSNRQNTNDKFMQKGGITLYNVSETTVHTRNQIS